MSMGIIPYPVKMEQGSGNFLFTENTGLSCSRELDAVYGFYRSLLEARLGFPLEEGDGRGTCLYLDVDSTLDLPEEGYCLEVTSGSAKITAPASKGVFYGLQSLLQLMAPGPDGKTVSVPEVSVEDYPRFSWRGLMLDVSRTFMSVPLVKRYIDLMASYKLNVLHFHLTDDQGWRLEIRKYPRLTSVGSKFDPEFNEMGGYYTREDIMDLVEYASLRNVMIVPEIELPGHACAAIASYPELSCRGVRPVIHPFVEGPGIHEEIMCAGKPEVYSFIFDVLDEVAAMFPSRYIHIGGDEAPKKEWEECPHCQRMMEENHLDNEEELQGLFVRKIGAHLASLGKRPVGWDEITEGGPLSGDEVIMYWRGGMDERIAGLAQEGFSIVSSPTSHCYFDYAYDVTDTQEVYSYDPVPVSVPEEARSGYIGVQANFWSHLDRAESRIDRQLFPRVFALAEVAWTAPDNKDWERFRVSAREHCELLRGLGVACFHDGCLY